MSGEMWAAAVGLIGVLLAVVGVLVKRDREAISKQVAEARRETKENHEAISAKVDRIETEVSEVRDRMSRFVTREEAERSHDRFLAEQRAERAELKGFLTAWLERIERALDRKADR